MPRNLETLLLLAGFGLVAVICSFILGLLTGFMFHEQISIGLDSLIESPN